jgi:hypothetical protein
MTRLLICAALALVLQICAAHGQAENPVKALAEHWRCGPYRLTITPDADLDFPNMVDFLDYKNGRDAGHTTNRARLTSTEDGARSVWWEGFTGATGSGDSQRWKYDAGGEIVTRNGASYYKEWVTGGKTGRELSYARHQCKKIAGPELIHSRMPVPLPRSRPVWDDTEYDWDFRERLWPRNRIWLTTPWKRPMDAYRGILRGRVLVTADRPQRRASVGIPEASRRVLDGDRDKGSRRACEALERKMAQLIDPEARECRKPARAQRSKQPRR